MRTNSQLLFWMLLTGVVAVAAYEIFVAHSINYRMSDAYYYSAVAEGFIKTGYFSDYTLAPKGAPVTPQNGIVFVHAGLIALGVTDQATRLIVIESILLVNLLLILYLLQKIAMSLDIGIVAVRLLLASFAFSYYIYAYWVAPLNDGFFASALYALIVLTLRLNTAPPTTRAWTWGGLFVLAAVIGEFRLQGISILLAAAAAFWLTSRRFWPAMGFILLAVVSYTVVAMVMVVTIQDFTMIKQFTAYSVSKYTVEGFIQWLVILVDDAIPSALLNFPAARLGDGILYWLRAGFSIAVLVSILAATIFYIKRPRFIQLLLLLNVLLTIGTLFAFQVIDRYFYISIPILWLLFVSHMPRRRNLQILAASAALALTMGSFVGRIALRDVSFVSNQVNLQAFDRAVAGRDYKLISEEPRITYFLFNRPSLVSDSDVQGGDNVVAIGQPAFVAQIVSRLQSRFETIEVTSMNLKWDLLYSVPGLDSESILIRVPGIPPENQHPQNH
jgi:hypothetical protein